MSQRFRNKERHSVFMNFDELYEWGLPTSDIDMFRCCSHTGFLIVGEIKNSIGKYDEGQRRLHQELVDNYSKGGAILFITHNNFVEEGSYEVNVAKCYVQEYYFNGVWRTPAKRITVLDAMMKLEGIQNATQTNNSRETSFS